MSLVLTSSPPDLHTTSNPVVYRFTRKDAFYYSLANDGGNMKLFFDVYGTSDNFIIGDSVTVVGTNGRSFTAEVLSIFVYAGFVGSGTVTLDYPYSSSISVSGYAILRTRRPNYKIGCQVVNHQTNENIGPEVSFSPSSTGEAICDLGVSVRSILNAEISYSELTSSEVQKDDNKLIKYHVSYREKWTGSSEPYNQAENRTAVFSARQVLQDSDMTDYFCNGSSKKFLTSFDVMRMVRGIFYSVPIITDPQEGAISGYPFVFSDAFSPSFS